MEEKRILLERCVARAHRRSRSTVHHSYQVSVPGKSSGRGRGAGPNGLVAADMPCRFKMPRSFASAGAKSMFGFDTKLPGNKTPSARGNRYIQLH